ncbi:zinc finger FYVE domain-containing protein 9-like [Ylistrum balloti]|uniref:zinc finger FYVE domain-containing protein 9-like n=1 Tax=Ylistrum balloti TaxID=509963 RepID=UPI002905AF78|nr:zinc finger FYVE domain-containing protein 9-like [Ylistrum balloti]
MMDSLIVDLDKVLDDFEAEEKESSQILRGSPTDYSEYINANDDRPWDEISHVPISTNTTWTSYSSEDEKCSTAVYDVPYIPAETFDLSEADFAPSVGKNGNSTYTGPLDTKVEDIYDNFTKDVQNAIQKQENLLKAVTAGHQDNGKLDHNVDGESRQFNSYSAISNSNVINNYSGTIDLSCKRNDVVVDTTGIISTKVTEDQLISKEQLSSDLHSPIKGGQTTILVADNTNCKYPIQVVDRFTPVVENKQFEPVVPTDNNEINGNLSNHLDESKSNSLVLNGRCDKPLMNGSPMDEEEESLIGRNEMDTTDSQVSSLSSQNETSSVTDVVTKDLSGSALSPSHCHNPNSMQMDNERATNGLVAGSDSNDVNPAEATMQCEGVGRDVPTISGSVAGTSGGMVTDASDSVVGFGEVDSDMTESDINTYLSDMQCDPGSVVTSDDQQSGVAIMSPDHANILNERGYAKNFDLVNALANKTSKPEAAGEQILNSKHEDMPGEVGIIDSPVVDMYPPQADTGLTSPSTAIQNYIALDEQTSPEGSSISSFGEGARPKELTRPNSLRGLSVVPFEAPSDISKELVEVASPQENREVCETNEGVSQDLTNSQTIQCIQASKCQSDGDDKLQTATVNLCDDEGVEVGDTVTDASSHTLTEVEAGDVDMEDAPVMLRSHDPPPYVNESQRPSSWSPAGPTLAVPPPQKRPNSLNLPSRGDMVVGNSERTQAPFRFPYQAPSVETATPESMETPEADVQEARTEPTPKEPEESPDEMNGAVGNAPEESMPTMDAEPSATQTENALGKVAPRWIPDAEAPLCMGCEAKFTFTKRRHHCRACGKVFCSTCCNLRSRLEYMENKEARVCLSCHQQLAIAEITSGTGRSPNPNNPSEYCSTIPPTQQVSSRSPPPTVMVPVGVLKREGSSKRSEPKQVMFSDGIRPGGDLTELDGSDAANKLPPRRTSRAQKRVDRGSPDSARSNSRKSRHSEARRNKCLIPESGLPPVILTKTDNAMDEHPDMAEYLTQIKDEEAEPVIFAVNSNLSVLVKIVTLDCCVNRTCWCLTTRGMCTVGQDEIVIVLEVLPDEDTLPRDILCHFQTMYEEAGKGNTVSDMGHTIFNQSFLNSRDHGGMLYIYPTFQCLHKLILPKPPYVFGILLQKWETPWAKVFPIRLLLRLGAEYRYYPCPLISVRNRKPVFFEIGHTIMNLLADFRNFQYMLPQIKGVTIHMEDKKTIMNFPRNRYEDLMKVVSNSNEHVMAIGASFSSQADSHLVCIQNDDGNYQTQAINIQNKPRKVTGASFVVFNGALKTSSGLRAKSSIVEDGLMVQITPDSMVALKQAMKDMREYIVECGSITNPAPDEVVMMQWVDDDKNINIGVKSPVDSMLMDGIESIHIPNATDYVGETYIIRWTDVFFIQNEDSGSAKWEPVDLSRLAETLSNACCIALTRHLDSLYDASLTKIGLRVNIEAEKVGYEIGANEEKLPDVYMNDLDNELIPVIHSAASQNHGGAIVLELIFHVLK